ncbi:recombinase family protein, partial [Mycobacterium tuberculosis]
PIYSGRIIWNRVRMVKDPATGKRVSRPNDPSEFRYADVPHLRIIDQTLFDAVQARKEAVGGVHANHAPRNKRVLSGLLKCGGCGGGLV